MVYLLACVGGFLSGILSGILGKFVWSGLSSRRKNGDFKDGVTCELNRLSHILGNLYDGLIQLGKAQAEVLLDIKSTMVANGEFLKITTAHLSGIGSAIIRMENVADSIATSASVIPTTVNALAKPLDDRGGEILEAAQDIRGILDSRTKLMMSDLGALCEFAAGLKIPEPVAPIVNEAPQPDPRVAEALEKVATHTGLLNGSAADMVSLGKGLLEIAKSLAETAHQLEKGNANPYEEYANRPSHNNGIDAMAERLAKDFGMELGEAAQLVQQGMRVKR